MENKTVDKELSGQGRGSAEYDKAIYYIYDLIREGSLGLGDRLPTERVIAQTLGIGRNSTREALRILHGMGMVESVQGSGNYISKNMGNSIRRMLLVMLALGTLTKQEMCEFRRVMEEAVCRMLLKKGLSPQQMEHCESLLQEMEVRKGDELVDTDQAFHSALIEATENSLFLTIMEAVTIVYREWIERALEKADEEQKKQLFACHREIYQGLVDHDADAMQAAIDRHYDLVEQML